MAKPNLGHETAAAAASGRESRAQVAAWLPRVAVGAASTLQSWAASGRARLASRRPSAGGVSRCVESGGVGGVGSRDDDGAADAGGVRRRRGGRS